MARYCRGSMRSRSWFTRRWRPTAKYNKNLKKKITSVVQKTTAVTVKRITTDPPIHNPQVHLRRKVRVVTGNANAVSPQTLMEIEAKYYDVTGVPSLIRRWRGLKIISGEIYGNSEEPALDVTIIPNGFPAATSTDANHPLTYQTAFTDIGDINHRAAIKFFMPANNAAYPYSSATASAYLAPFLRFAEGTVSYVDVLCEFF